MVRRVRSLGPRTGHRAGFGAPGRHGHGSRRAFAPAPKANFLEDLTKMFKGDPSEACRKRYEQKLDRINALESYMKGLSDEQLRGKTEELRGRVMKNAGEGDGPVDQKAVFTDDIVCEAFALVREGALRAIGLRPFDCQVIGGLVLRGRDRGDGNGRRKDFGVRRPGLPQRPVRKGGTRCHRE